MNDDRVRRLTVLKDELQSINPPDYPNPFWPLIDRWIGEATPIMRSDWNEHFADFEKSTIPPNDFRMPQGNSSSRQKQQRQWELDNSKTEQVRRKILSFLDGLLKIASDSKKKPSLPASVLVARYGLIGAFISLLGILIPTYLNYISTRPQVKATQIPAALTVSPPDSNGISSPTLTSVQTQPFTVFVTIEGEVEQKEPSFPLLVPAPVEVSIRLELPDNSVDHHCKWDVLRALPNPLPDTESCFWSFSPPTFNDTSVRVTVYTSDGNSFERILIFQPE